MPFFIGAACLDVRDQSCVEVCPVDCIYEGDRRLYINPHECIDCGACEPECPVSAISSDLRLPGELAPWRDDNARFFDEPLPGRPGPLGSPGGAAAAGRIGADTSFSAATPAAPEAAAERH